ncbi:MAG: hypothetical protein KF898_01355 [Parachlamydiales bacterium]|nr:hypothetical protein [Verrucomicrobiota bacterium]MBX3718277.1 hypothetical protein [Candidatus Acheromyda pituitae]
MISDPLPPIYKLLLSIQSSLLNAVAPQLRAVLVDVDSKNTELFVAYFYDGEISNDLRTLATVAIAEIDMDPFNYVTGDIAYRLDYPEKIPVRGKLAYLRKEPVLPEINRENRSFFIEEDIWPLYIFQLDMQEALLGKVTPSLRLVTVRIDPHQRKLISNFYYDGKISDEDFRLAQAAIQDARISFPDYSIESQIERIDFPNKIPVDGCTAVYWRWENKY